MEKKGDFKKEDIGGPGREEKNHSERIMKVGRERQKTEKIKQIN